MTDFSVPDLDRLVAPSAPSAPSAPRIEPNLVVPTYVGNRLTSIDPAAAAYGTVPSQDGWTYRKFQFTDVFFSKIGISALTSLASFAVLTTINPPFVQSKSENEIESGKTNFLTIYIISALVFVLMMVLPAGSRTTRL
jgi:hypothetical protein